MLTPDIIQAAKNSVLCWLATVDAQGQPHVSPKEIYAVFDAEHFVVAHIASPTSVRNIKYSSKVCLSFVDVFVQKGYKILGTAKILEPTDPAFQHWATPLLAMAGPRFAVHSVIVLRAEAVLPILAPSYHLYPETTTEQNQIAAAHRRYGVTAAGQDTAGCEQPERPKSA